MSTATRRRDPMEHRAGEAGFSTIVVGVSLLATAILVVVAISLTLGSGTTPTSQGSGNPEVATADRVQAQTSLRTALASVQAGALGSGSSGGSGIPAVGAGAGATGLVAQLSATEPSLSFVSGVTSGPTTVSVATDGAGAVTLATRSSDGVCWLVWRGQGATVWYGAQTGLSSCAAPALGSPPSPGPVSGSAIGWQTNGFPPA